MGIFNIFKKNRKGKKESGNELFTPFTIKTENVSEVLTETSKRYNTPLSTLDFEVLDVETYIKFSKESEFAFMDKQALEVIENKNLLENSDFEIKQVYEIKVKKIEFSSDIEIIGELRVDKDKTKIDYILSPSSILHYSDLLEFNLIEEFHKKKIKSNLILFEPFEPTFLNDIKELVAKVRVLGNLEQNYIINLCKAIKPIYPVSLSVIEHYKKNEQEDRLIKSLIYPIKKGETILEIKKPKAGKNGRDCSGKVIKVPPFKEQEIPIYRYKNGDVIKKEDKDKVLYIANRDGYVYMEGGDFISIKDELEVNQISLKTGNVKKADESNIKLEVKEQNVLKEAIKDRMIVETTELLVKGNVGNGAKIKAKKLEIDGQTHKGSKIVAEVAEINSHKGVLKSKKAIINRLEGGVVKADYVLVNQAISGKIVAKEIKIKVLGSHLTLIASDIIEIDRLKGYENHFVISETLVENREEKINSLKEKREELKREKRKLKNKYIENRDILTTNQPFIEKLKQRIELNRKKGIVVNPIFIQKLKKYNEFLKATKEIKDRIEKIGEEIKSINHSLNRYQNSIFFAKIVSHSGFKEFNRIEFHLINPPLKLSYDTKASDSFKNSFKVEEQGEYNFKIVGESE